MKRWHVISVVVLLLAVSITGWFIQGMLNGRSHSGNLGVSAGRGIDMYSFPLSPDLGGYVHFEVASVDSRTMDVYLTDQAGFEAARSGLPFERDPDFSELNTTRVVGDIRIMESSRLVVMSHDPDGQIRVASSIDQARYPLELGPALYASSIICWIAILALFALLLQAWLSHRKKRARHH
jgi:hypothetical protein